jgi:xanthine dehydrogenase YagR molybdenum-binding subunit
LKPKATEAAKPAPVKASVKAKAAPAKAAPGVIAIVTAENAGKLGKGKYNTAKLLGGPEIQHYHQAVAVVVAETFEQARAAAYLVLVDYARAPGNFDLA